MRPMNSVSRTASRSCSAPARASAAASPRPSPARERASRSPLARGPPGARGRGARRRGEGVRRRQLRLERMRSLVAEVEADLGPVEILVLNTGGAAARHRPRARRRGVGGGIPLPRARAPRPLRGGPHRDEGTRLGPDRQRRLLVDQGADPRLALSNSNRMATVGLLNTLAREVAGDGITSTRSRPGASPPNGCRGLRRIARGGRARRRRAGAGRPARDAPRSTAT